MSEGRGRHLRYESGVFTDHHIPILQALVDGLQTIEEIAQKLGKKTGRIDHLRGEITSTFADRGLGKDNIAKAVVHAVVHDLVKFDVIDRIRPKRSFSDRETNVLTAVALGLDNRQIADHLSITKEEVKEDLLGIMENLGVRSRYTALAWGLRRSLQKLQITK